MYITCDITSAHYVYSHKEYELCQAVRGREQSSNEAQQQVASLQDEVQYMYTCMCKCFTHHSKEKIIGLHEHYTHTTYYCVYRDCYESIPI